MIMLNNICNNNIEINPSGTGASFFPNSDILLDKTNKQLFNNINKAEDDSSDIAIIAHRGYSSEAPENTIPAFILAAENGYDTVECDIQWTKDSVPVLLHDNTINRTARRENGWGFLFRRKCSNYSFEELQRLDFGSWKGEEYKGTKIPSFYEALDCSNEYDLNMYVELKEDSNFDSEKAKILAEAVKEAGMEEKITWISFNPEYLKMMSELMPESRLGYLYEKEPDAKTIQTLQNLKTENNEVFLDIKASKMTDKADELLDNAGFDFEAWTVDDEQTLEEMYSYECIGITTNKLTEDQIDNIIDSFE